MNEMDAEACRVIDALGGNTKVAELCEIRPQAVAQWRRDGLPSARRQFLRAVHPELFLYSEAAKAACLTALGSCTVPPALRVPSRLGRAACATAPYTWTADHWVGWWMTSAPTDSEAHRRACEARWVIDFWRSTAGLTKYLDAVEKRRGQAARQQLEADMRIEKDRRR